MEPFFIFIALATLGELLIEGFKPALDPIFSRLNVPPDINPYLYLSMTFGILLAFTYQADLLHVANLVPEITIVGTITTGLLFGRGANVIHDIIELLAGNQ